MSLTAGTLSKVLISQNTVNLLSTAASGGTGPYTQQWYMSTTTGFTPGVGNLVASATALAQAFSGMLPGTTYYFKVVYTDTGAGNATITSAQLQVDTLAAQPKPNQFAPAPYLGQLDQGLNYNSKAAQIDASSAGGLIAGQAVKIVDSAGGIPKVVECAANSDEVWGFINYEPKNRTWKAGDKVEISQKGNVMYLYSTGPIARGVQVQLDLTVVGGVAAKVGSSGADILGFAYDKATVGGQLFRVELQVPSYAKA